MHLPIFHFQRFRQVCLFRIIGKPIIAKGKLLFDDIEKREGNNLLISLHTFALHRFIQFSKKWRKQIILITIVENYVHLNL